MVLHHFGVIVYQSLCGWYLNDGCRLWLDCRYQQYEERRHTTAHAIMDGTCYTPLIVTFTPCWNGL
jgi:hypothetical protein